MDKPRVHLPVIDSEEESDPRFRRPRKIRDCATSVRPCPWVSCKFNLLIDVVDEGGIVLNAGHRRAEGGGRVIPPRPNAEERFRDELEDAIDWWFDEVDPENPLPSCAVEEAVKRQPDDNNVTLLDEIAAMMYVTRERVRQIEAGALQKLKDEDLLDELIEAIQEMRRARDDRDAAIGGEE